MHPPTFCVCVVLQADCLCDLLQRNFAITHSNLIRINRIQGRSVEVHMRVVGLRSFVREVLMESFNSGFILAAGSTSSDVRVCMECTADESCWLVGWLVV